MPDDAELLRRYAVAKSEPAFAELVARYVDLVYSAALRQVGGDAHRAHDVAQIVFATLARKAATLARHPVLAGWLYNTTRHVAQRAVRTEQRRRIREAEACRMNQDEREEGAIEWERIRPVLDDAMRELAERDREAVVLRFFAHRPFAEIGRVLGLSEDAARMRVDRALEKLRGRLARRGVASAAAALSVALANQAVAAAPVGMAAGISASAIATTSVAALGPALAMVEFMSTSKILLGSATLLVALTLATAVHEAQASRAARVALAQAQADLTATHGRLSEWERRVASVEQDTARWKAEADALRASRAAEQARNRPAQSVATSTVEGDAFITRHPELQRLIAEEQRARAAGSYAALFKQLRLTSPQIERFKDLAWQGGIAGFTGLGNGFARYHMGGDRQQAEGELRELLGDGGFQLYKNYYEVLGAAFDTTTQLAADLSYTGTPLNVPQAEQLQQILMDGRKSVEWSNRLRFDWPGIMARAANVLGPEQLAALGDLSAHDKFDQALTRARSRGEIK